MIFPRVSLYSRQHVQHFPRTRAIFRNKNHCFSFYKSLFTLTSCFRWFSLGLPYRAYNTCRINRGAGTIHRNKNYCSSYPKTRCMWTSPCKIIFPQVALYRRQHVEHFPTIRTILNINNHCSSNFKTPCTLTSIFRTCFLGLPCTA
jgi:hypothetical protein